MIVPPSLRLNALESIHAAHQGSSSMMSTAESTVFWPNITKYVRPLSPRAAEDLKGYAYLAQGLPIRQNGG